MRISPAIANYLECESPVVKSNACFCFSAVGLVVCRASAGNLQMRGTKQPFDRRKLLGPNKHNVGLDMAFPGRGRSLKLSHHIHKASLVEVINIFPPSAVRSDVVRNTPELRFRRRCTRFFFLGLLCIPKISLD